MDIAKKWGFILCLVTLAGCSSSSSELTDDDDPTIDENLATFVQWAGSAWTDVAASVGASKTFTVDFPVECADGGSMDSDDDGATVSIDDCVETIGGTTYLSRGDYTVTESGDLTTHEWDQTILIDDNGDGTFDDDEQDFTSTGSISFNTDGDQIAFDYSGVFGNGTLQLTGIVSDNDDGTSDVTFYVILDDEAYQEGSFDDADLDTLSDDDVDTACDDNSTSTCATQECSVDFECQLFAGDDQSDDFETGNTICTDGCCALDEDVEVAECPDTGACPSGDFDCQLLAANDSSYTFSGEGACNTTTGCCE
ncbi:MAG: hypothetical protein Q7T11_04940 [Deltaproteobacteria bacterium]|nr:hypothetical protein [Deltaproteobacteria bacterium]